MLVKSRKSSFNSNIGEFCSVFFCFCFCFFLWRIKLLRYISNFKVYAIKRVKRVNFCCTRRTRNVLSTFV